jgi:hypothetical protein
MTTPSDRENSPLKSLFEDNVTVNSFVRVSLNESSEEIGVSRSTMETMYNKYNMGQWNSVSPDWVQRVKYTCKPSTGDANTDNIKVAYLQDDPLDVIAYRSNSITTVYSSNAKFDAEIKRYLVKETLPPGSTDRYHQLTIQYIRKFTRFSTSVANVIWTYSFIVEWNGKSIKAAYNALPKYKIQLELDSRDVQLGKDMNIWLVDSLKNKLHDLIGANTISFEPKATTEKVDNVEFEPMFLDDDEYMNETDEQGIVDDDGENEQTEYTSS